MDKRLEKLITDLDYLLDLYIDTLDNVYEYHYLSEIHESIHRYFGYKDAVETVAELKRKSFRFL